MKDWVNNLLGYPREPPDADLEEALALARQREEELLEERERLRSVFLKTPALNATLNSDRVLQLVLELASHALAWGSADDSRLIVAMFLFEGETLRVAGARGLTSADMRVTMPASEGLFEQVISRGTMILCENPADDPELRRVVAIQTASIAAAIPLVVGIEVYGVLLVAHPREDYFTEDRLELLDVVAQQAIVAFQNARLYNELIQEKERISEIQEETRHKLARDLHDGPTQSIGAIAMRVNFARRLLERDPKAASEELYKIEELARKTTKEIRQMLFTLRPLVLESEGLVAAVQHLAAKTGETHQQEVLVEIDPAAIQDMEIGRQGVVFYIIEEAVNNARKHAGAPHIWVRIRREEDVAVLQVEDDGSGFDVGEVESSYDQRGSLGLVNLRERSELVDGRLHIDSEVGRGTLVSVSIPLSEEAAERLRRPGLATT
jgi:signal transduction histidine kinase